MPAGIANASFLWQRGPKLQFTEATPVSETGRTAYWDQVLKQVHPHAVSLSCRATAMKALGILDGEKDEIVFVQGEVPRASVSCGDTLKPTLGYQIPISFACVAECGHRQAS